MLDWNKLARFKQHGVPDDYPPNLLTFWAGHDDAHGLLAEVLKSAHQSIVLNMFGYDDDLLDEILRSKMQQDRIYVQMSLDRSQSKGVHEKALLAKWPTEAIGTSIAIGDSVHHAISHLKVCVVDGMYTVTGSTNWSTSGETKQDNQLLLVRDPVLAHEYATVMAINHDVMLSQMAERYRDEPARPWEDSST